MAELTFKPFTIENLREAGDFARAYLWEVYFPEAPDDDRFKAWFPASELDESSFAVESDQAEFYDTLIKFPKKLNLPKITLTFYDSEDRIFYRWIRNWIANGIFNLNVPGVFPSVSALEDAVKEVYVVKLSHDKQPVDVVSYWVYPESIGDRGTSGNELSMFSVPFVVAGMSAI